VDNVAIFAADLECLLGYCSKIHTLNFLALFWDSFLKICSDLLVLESEGATIFIESMSVVDIDLGQNPRTGVVDDQKIVDGY
jgi:hypothetical protein